MKAFCAVRRPVIACCCKTLLSLAVTVPSAQASDDYSDVVIKVSMQGGDLPGFPS